MSDHIGDELPALLSGELDLARTGTMLRHARDCGPCSDALHEALHAHLALARAARSLRPQAPAGSLSEPQATPAAAPRPRSRRILAAAAAVVIAAGAAAAGYAAGRPGPSAQPAVVATGLLRPVSGGTAPPGATGSVVMTVPGAASRQMTITISGLPAPSPGHFYEVWLLAPATGKMLAVGVLALGPGPATYRLPASVTPGYGAVDISLQQNDGNPAHSADSVLRATIRAAQHA
jgi:hypothetical protein